MEWEGESARCWIGAGRGKDYEWEWERLISY
jgi:hypothetical protein